MRSTNSTATSRTISPKVILSRGAIYFDRNILGINPDYTIKIRHDILLETDGPMLKYGIRLLDKKGLILPKDKRNYPDKDRLSIRFEEFLKAG